MRLIFRSESPEGRVVDIDCPRLTIGRVAGNHVQLADEKVSGRHAVIELREDGHVVLSDLSSRNGTFVDGQRLSEERILLGGEELRFGDQLVRVEAAPGSPGGSVPAAPVDVGPEPDPPAPRASRRRGPREALRTHRAVALSLALALVLVLGVAQLFLPGVAEHRLRSDLARYGPVGRVHIESLPAIKLLWHRADRVEVVMDSYRSEPSGHGSLADFLSRTRDTGKLDVRVGVLHTQLLTLHEVRLHKQGDLLVGQAQLSQRDLSSALPSFLGLRPVAASGEGIVVQVSASVLGQRVSAHVQVLAESGRVVVRPEGLPFASLAEIKVFDDPRVYVESLGAQLHGQEYLLTARARLR